MIKLTFCIYRLPHMSQEEFLSYWLDTHGPLVKKHASTLNIRRYLQQHPADQPINEANKKNRGTAGGGVRGFRRGGRRWDCRQWTKGLRMYARASAANSGVKISLRWYTNQIAAVRPASAISTL